MKFKKLNAFLGFVIPFLMVFAFMPTITASASEPVVATSVESMDTSEETKNDTSEELSENDKTSDTPSPKGLSDEEEKKEQKPQNRMSPYAIQVLRDVPIGTTLTTSDDYIDYAAPNTNVHMQLSGKMMGLVSNKIQVESNKITIIPENSRASTIIITLPIPTITSINENTSFTGIAGENLEYDIASKLDQIVSTIAPTHIKDISNSPINIMISPGGGGGGTFSSAIQMHYDYILNTFSTLADPTATTSISTANPEIITFTSNMPEGVAIDGIRNTNHKLTISGGNITPIVIDLSNLSLTPFVTPNGTDNDKFDIDIDSLNLPTGSYSITSNSISQTRSGSNVVPTAAANLRGKITFNILNADAHVNGVPDLISDGTTPTNIGQINTGRLDITDTSSLSSKQSFTNWTITPKKTQDMTVIPTFSGSAAGPISIPISKLCGEYTIAITDEVNRPSSPNTFGRTQNSLFTFIAPEIPVNLKPITDIEQKTGTQISVNLPPNVTGGNSGQFEYELVDGPSWITVNKNTGAISGKSNKGGTSKITVLVRDKIYPNNKTTQDFAITLIPALNVDNLDKMMYIEGESLSDMLRASGGYGTYTFRTIVPYPGITIKPDGTIISSIAVPGDYPVTIEVSDGSSIVEIDLFVKVVEILELKGRSLGTQTSEVEFFQLPYSGGLPAHKFSIVGASGSGFSVTNSGVLISQPTSDGVYKVTVRAEDSFNQVSDHTYTINMKGSRDYDVSFEYKDEDLDKDKKEDEIKNNKVSTVHDPEDANYNPTTGGGFVMAGQTLALTISIVSAASITISKKKKENI